MKEPSHLNTDPNFHHFWPRISILNDTNFKMKDGVCDLCEWLNSFEIKISLLRMLSHLHLTFFSCHNLATYLFEKLVNRGVYVTDALLS